MMQEEGKKARTKKKSVKIHLGTRHKNRLSHQNMFYFSHLMIASKYSLFLGAKLTDMQFTRAIFATLTGKTKSPLDSPR